MFKKTFRFALSCFTFISGFLFTPSSLQAHPLYENKNFATGFIHPINGLDHILAMIAVGLWATQLGGHKIWQVPLIFVGTMCLSAQLALYHVSIPLIEQGIAASVFILGLTIMFAVRLPLLLSAFLVALFAIFHGYAHGLEMDPSAHLASYQLGFVTAALILHGSGILFGKCLQFFLNSFLIRATGLLIAIAGLVLSFG